MPLQCGRVVPHCGAGLQCRRIVCRQRLGDRLLDEWTHIAKRQWGPPEEILRHHQQVIDKVAAKAGRQVEPTALLRGHVTHILAPESTCKCPEAILRLSIAPL